MRKILAATILLACTSAFAEPVVVDLRAEAFGYDVHPGIHFEPKGNFYLNVWNNTDHPQAISIVYNLCADGGGCASGEATHSVEPHTKWEHTWHVSLPGCEYGAGEYINTSAMDVRVDSTGKHYRHFDRQIIRSHY